MAQIKTRGAARPLVPRPASELQGLLANHLDSLVLFCVQFDLGKSHLASEIATNLRVLLHHNPATGSKSLVHQMGLQNTAFCDTERACVNGQSSFGCAPHGGFVRSVVVEGTDGQLTETWGPSPASTRALLAFRTPLVQWWTSTVLLLPTRSFSRKNIITLIANQDRGAHVAPGIDKAFFGLTRQNSHASAFQQQLYHSDGMSDPSRPLIDADRIHIDKSGSGATLARALIRQFAHEVLLTLLPNPDQYLTQLPPPPEGVPGVPFILVKFTQVPANRKHWPAHALASDDFPIGNKNTPFED